MQSEFEILSALVDGEPVDPAELDRVLALPGARRTLVELADLRRTFAADRALPRPDFADRVRPTLAPPGSRSFGESGWRWAVIAAVAMVALALLLPPWLAPAPADPPPPPPDRVLRFDPDLEWTAS